MKTVSMMTIAVAILAQTAAAQAVTNGSMTGPPTIGTPPPGWASISTDGDTVGVGGVSGWATGIGASSDGGTFLAVLNNGGGGAFDAASQTISGFTIGDSYTLAFEWANIGLDTSAASDYANEGFIRASIGGVDMDAPSIAHEGFGSQNWYAFSDTFVATASTMDLTFTAMRFGNGGYAGGVDGVSIRVVPSPGALALIGLGGLAGMRRRR